MSTSSAPWPVRWLIAAWLCSADAACAFEPVARRAQPRRVDDTPYALGESLDPFGKHLLVEHSAEATEPRAAILDWQAGTLCTLPPEVRHDLRPLPRPAGADPATHPFYLPRLSDADSDADAELVMVDETCEQHGPYGYMSRGSAQYMVSTRDGRGLLIGRDSQANALLFDPHGEPSARVLARAVSFSKPASTDGKDPRDVVWLVEDGLLTLRTIAGSLLLTRGRGVSEVALRGDQRSVAYVDEGVLYEASAPRFEPQRIAPDACSPGYLGTDLTAFSPCAQKQFVARYGDQPLTHYPPGVFAAARREGLELTYVAVDDDTFELYVRAGDEVPVLVDPPMQPRLTFVLEDGRLLGVTVLGELGVFTPSSRRFERVLSGVAKVLSEYRGKSHSYSFLVHHDLVDGLGTLSIVEAPALTVRELARGVPPQDRGGFLMEEGRAFPSYPFAAPTVVALSDAQMDSEHVSGRLRAALITDPSDDVLARKVSSYLLVARPVPGVLYSISEGEDRGLWYAAF